MYIYRKKGAYMCQNMKFRRTEMKRILALILAILLIVPLCGCENKLDKLYSYVEENGADEDGVKRVYTSVRDKESTVIYLEAGKNNTLILGYRLLDGFHDDNGNFLTIYLDGDEDPRFEARQHISFMLLGRAVDLEATAKGVVDTTASPQVLDIELYNGGELVDTTGTSHQFNKQETFERVFNEALEMTMETLPALLIRTGTGVTMEDLGLEG